MKDRIKSIIDAKQNESGNASGTTINFIMAECGLKYDELKPILNDLVADKFIKVREGVNGRLIFKR